MKSKEIDFDETKQEFAEFLIKLTPCHPADDIPLSNALERGKIEHSEIRG